MSKPRFKDRMMQNAYEGSRKAAADNWSEFYFTKTTAGQNPFGPNMPHRGAAHRCAYWDGRKGMSQSMYGRAKTMLGYAFFAAGAEDRKQALKKQSTQFNESN